MVILTLVSLIFLESYFVTFTLADDASLTDIVVTNTQDHLLVYFAVNNWYTQDMKKAIDNGIDTAFTFIIKLYEVRNLWWDRKIADIRVKHHIQYDNLKKVYGVKLAERNYKTIYVEDFEEARNLMSEIVGLKVTGLHNLQKGRQYQVRMMAELDKIELPLYLHYVFFFLSLWNFETDWYTVDFRY